jgi:hypothetical protein
MDHPIDVFMRTYPRDIPWLRFCLRSVQRHLHGHQGVVITYPQGTGAAFAPLRNFYGYNFAEVLKKHRNDYIGQQITKMEADTICGAEYICHIDSDNFIHAPLNVQSFIDTRGRTLLLRSPYAKLGPDAQQWRGVVANALGFWPDYEYMRRFPIVYPRWFYNEVRVKIEKHTGRLWNQFAAEVGDLSEFNVMGAVADRYFADRFDIRTEGEPNWVKTQFLHQYWSHGGLKPDQRAYFESCLR